MSDSSSAPRDGSPPDEGATTSGWGTPVAVDLAAEPGSRRTIALFLAGPVIWSLHFMLVYVVVEAGCTGAGQGLEELGPPVPTVVTLVATAVAAVALCGTAAWAYRRWRRLRHARGQGPGLEPHDRAGALSFAGFALSLLGLVEVLFVGLPALVLPAC